MIVSSNARGHLLFMAANERDPSASKLTPAATKRVLVFILVKEKMKKAWKEEKRRELYASSDLGIMNSKKWYFLLPVMGSTQK